MAAAASSSQLSEEQRDKLCAQVRRQVEFYFSDSNLPRDKFLSGEVAKSEEGFVPIETLASFKRMQALTTDAELIVTALRASKELVVSDDGKNVRRKEPLPGSAAEVQRVIDARSVYAEDYGNKDATMEEVTAFFGRFGTVKSVRMRRNADRTFRGSVFVEYSSPEEAAKVAARGKISSSDTGAASEGGEPVAREDGGFTVTVRTKAAFVEELAKIRASKERRNAAAAAAAAGENGGTADASGAEVKVEFEKGLILKLDGLANTTTREHIKAFFDDLEVAYVDFSMGQTDGFVRFASAAVATSGGAMLDGKKELNGAVPTGGVIEGEAEEAYWKKVFQLRAERKSKPKRGGGRRR